MEAIAKVHADFPQDRAMMAQCKGWTEAAGVGKVDGLIWIPTDAEQLQLPLLVIARTGAMGHRGTEVTKKVLSEVFTWRGMSNDVELIARHCL
jgi:hypothetical protein